MMEQNLHQPSQEVNRFSLDPFRAVPMTEILESCGISVNGTGLIPCPVHKEQQPSCRVYDDHVHCFGCGFHADTIGIVRQLQGLDFWPSVNWIADTAGLPRPQRSPEAQVKYEVVQSLSDSYTRIHHDSLRDPEPALTYLESRGISRETMNGIVGYLPPKYQPPDPKGAKQAGLYSKNGNFLFSDCLVIPFLHQGRIITLYGRALDDDRIPKHIYPASTDPLMPATLFNLDACRKEDEILLADSIIDAVTFIDRGFKNTVGLFGTQGLTDARLETLKRTNVQEVVLVFDSDRNQSGQQAVLKAGEKLFQAGYQVKIISLPLTEDQEKCDPNSYFHDHSPEDFEQLPRRDFFQCLLDSVPAEGGPQVKFKCLVPVMKLVAEQPELLWKQYISTIHTRLPDFDSRKIEKELSVYVKAADESKTKAERFLPLEYVAKIRDECPVICSGRQAYRYCDGVYVPWHPEEIDQKIIQLYGPKTQPNHLHAVREFLNSVCYVRPELINPRDFLNLQNGVLHLASGELLPHSPDRFITVQVRTRFDPMATCPLWMKTLEQILPEPGARLLLAQYVGYSLTSDNSYHKGLIMLGDGANGKSVIQQVWEAVGTENCSALYLSDFKERFRLVELQDRLVNFSAEVEAKGLVDDARIKAVISGDGVTVERKNQPVFKIAPTCKIVVSCNSLPPTADRTHGYFRRWLIIPFTQTFEAAKRDRGRANRIIQTELSGVLNWAISGYKSLLKAGEFTETESSLEALQEYRRQSNPAIDFMEENVSVFEGDHPTILLQDAYRAYRVSGQKTMALKLWGRNNFRKEMERITGRLIRKTEHGRAFPGMALK